MSELFEIGDRCTVMRDGEVYRNRKIVQKPQRTS